jgi:hypothetical protein
MMLRDGALLMRGGGRKEGGKRTGGGGELIAGRSRRDHQQCRWETEKDRRGSDREW